MKIQVQRKLKAKEGVLVISVFEDQLKSLPEGIPAGIKDLIGKLIKAKDFTAKNGQIITTYFEQKGLPPRLMVVGLGREKGFNSKTARETGGKIGKQLKAEKAKEATVLLGPALSEVGGELYEGIRSSQYDIGKFKSGKKKKYTGIQNLTFISDSKSLPARLKRRETICEATEFVKDLVNAPANYVDADYMAREAKGIAKRNRYKIAVFGRKELKKMGWGGLLAVNQGSANEAKAIVLQYDGAEKKSEAPIVLVGKGVIFDSGGYSIKGGSSMATMHQDMAGGATVIGVFKALKDLGIKKNVIGIIPATENLISSDAYRPSDIITMFNDKTVEITNTDAEGRMILADALSYGTKFKPQAIISIATLTGAVGVALGNRYAGVFGNNTKLRKELVRAGRKVGDWGWSLPMPKDYREKMKSKVADYKNYDIATGGLGGASKAAAFLSFFVEKHKWSHIDIGGTAFTDDPLPHQTAGATAHGLQMLIRFLES